MVDQHCKDQNSQGRKDAVGLHAIGGHDQRPINSIFVHSGNQPCWSTGMHNPEKEKGEQ